VISAAEVAKVIAAFAGVWAAGYVGGLTTAWIRRMKDAA